VGSAGRGGNGDTTDSSGPHGHSVTASARTEIGVRNGHPGSAQSGTSGPGVGQGGDLAREYSAFGEDADAHWLGRVLTEGTEALTALWAGEMATCHGSVLVNEAAAGIWRCGRRGYE
jgi:hypothetical protein